MNNHKPHFLILISSIFMMSFSISSAQYKAYHISDEKLLNISIDGNLNEWKDELQNYSIPNTMLYSSMKSDSNNFKTLFFVGWNEIVNKIYIIAEVYDDSIIVDSANVPYSNDCIELIINPTSNPIPIPYRFLGGGDAIFKNIPTHVGMKLVFSNNSDRDKLDIIVGPNWLKKKENCDIAISIKKYGDKFKICYELSMSLWDYWYYDNENFSSRHLLNKGEKIGLTIKVEDLDELICYENKFFKRLKYNEYKTTNKNNWWYRAEDSSDFELVGSLPNIN